MRNRITTLLWAVALSLTAVFGSIGCMVSGFSLDSISFLVALSWILAAVVFAVCFSYRIGLYPLLGLALLGGYLWQRGYLSLSMELLLQELFDFYDGAYGWGTVSWSGESLADTGTGTALCWLGLPVVISTAWAVVRRSDTWLAVIVMLLPLGSCMVVTDTVPGLLPLFALGLCVMLLLMTQTVRRRDEAQGNRLTALLTLPIAAALGLLFLLIPQDSYDRQEGAQQLEDMVVGWFEEEIASVELPKLPQVTTPQVTLPNVTLPQLPSTGALSRENLELVGPKVESDMRIMTVTAEQSGMLYLRGESFDSYTGTAWTAQEDLEDGHWPEPGLLNDAGEVTVSTVTTHDLLYLPYYASQDAYEDLRGGKADNDGDWKRYTFSQGTLPEDYLLSVSGTGFEGDTDPYLQLPESTRTWASTVIVELFGTETPELSARTVYTICEYVRSSASYSLDTPRMSYGYGDFARWFLTESDTGYCVHFASATAVLLRAAGIPSRYVTGYTVYAEAGQEVAVTGQHAHAWVEFRLPGTVWHPLESTAAEDPDDPDQPELPQPTFPEETEPEETVPEETEPEQMFSEPTTQPQQTQPTVPHTQPQDENTPSEGGSGALWGWVIGIAAAVTLVVAQWRVRVSLRRSRRKEGRSKRKALQRWQEHQLLARLLKQTPDRELLELAQKAKFSQHTITSEELALFTKHIRRQHEQLKKKPFLFQLYYTLILALY